MVDLTILVDYGSWWFAANSDVCYAELMIGLMRDFVQLVIGLIEILLSFRFVLKLLAANSAASFVGWIYATTEPLLQPFLFAFPTPSVKGGFVLEFTTLFAIFAYAFIGYMVIELLEVVAGKK